MPELPLVGDEFAGYQLRGVLGRGGMSTVYQAENPRLGNLVALKVLLPELATDDVFRARFLEESRIAAGMNHPHVIPIHDTGSSDGLLYIAMRYVSGTNLGQMIKKRGRLPPETAVLLLSQAARALDAAHRRGLVHRDVKPANLLVERGNDDSDPDHLYLADFGITKMANSGRTGLTSTGQFVGTVDYVAPEQIRGLSVLGMADQYSLGCVLYECLTGRVPFEKDLNEAIMWAHMEEQPTRPTLLRPDLPYEIDEVFSRVLAKQAGDRYESCRAFMAAAREVLGPMTVRPADGPLRALRPPPPGGYRERLYPELAHDGLGAGTPDMAGMPDMAADMERLEPERAPSLFASAPEDGSLTDATADPPAGGPGGLNWLDRSAGADWPSSGAGPGGSRGGGGSGAGGRDARQPPAHRRRRDARGVLLLAIIAVLIALAAGFGAGRGLAPHAGGSARAGSSGTAPAGAAAAVALTPPVMSSTSTKTLQQALAAVNVTVWTTGYLPPGSCAYLSTAYATCRHPYAGITEAIFQNYSSPAALYKAYDTAIRQANAGQVVVNEQDCGATAPPPGGAETAWNHLGLHSGAYSIAQMESGKLDPATQAAGRLFCRYNHATQVEDIIWTQTDGNMLGEVTGAPHLQVWYWWLHVHHNIAFSGQPMGTMDTAPGLFPKA